MLDALNSYEQDVADEPEVTNIKPPTLKKPIKKDTENNKQIPPDESEYNYSANFWKTLKINKS